MTDFEARTDEASKTRMEAAGGAGAEAVAVAPSAEAVAAAVHSLYHDPDPKKKEEAGNWLQALQKSTHAWTVADQLLHRKFSMESCYIAAQTMRTKIQHAFHELPPEFYTSLR